MRVVSINNINYRKIVTFKGNVNNQISQATIDERIKELQEYEVEHEDAEEFAKLDLNRYKDVISLLQNGITPIGIKKVLKLKEQQYKQAVDSISLGISSSDIFYMAELKKERYKTAKKLRQQGLNPDYLRIFTSISEKEREKALSISKRGYPPNISVIMSKLNNKQRLLFQYLIKKGIIIDLAFEISKLPKRKRIYCTELINNGICAEDAIRIAQLNKKSSKRAKKLLLQNIDTEVIADLAQLKKQELTRAIELYNQGVNPEYITDIILTENGIFEDGGFSDLLKKGYGLSCAMSISLLLSSELDKLIELTKKYPEIKDLYKQDYVVDIVSDQLTDEPEGIFTKKMRLKDGSSITLVKTFSMSGIQTKSRTEKYPDNSTSSMMTNGNRVIRVKRDELGQIKESLHIMFDENTPKVTGAIYSQASDILPGGYDTQEFTIDEFRQDSSDDIHAMDFDINMITTKEGKTLSKAVKNPDGSISYFEDFETNGYQISRNYKEKKQSNANIDESEYSFKINDENGNSVLNIQRYTKKNNDGTVTNIINGIRYTISFDEKRKTIKITDGQKTKSLDFKNRLPVISRKDIWELLKNQPVDTLLTLDKNIKEFCFCSDLDSQAELKNKILSVSKNFSIISHETGHIKDKEIANISDNQKLIETYDDEMIAFISSFPYSEQEYTMYFSQRAELTNSIGIDEFIAETNMLLTTYGTDIKSLKTRAQFLVRYFPKTITLVAELLGKTSTKSLLE